MISIITCIYNKLDFVKQIIGAVEKNTDVKYEHILILNSDLPDVREYVLSLKGKFIIVPPANIGIARGFNMGLKCASHDYIVKLDDDVVVPSNWSSVMIKAFTFVPDLAASAINLDWGKPQSISQTENTMIDKTIDGLRIEELTRASGMIGFHCVMFRKSLLDKIGGIAGHKYYGGDEIEFVQYVNSNNLKMCYIKDYMSIHLSKFKDDVRRNWQIESAYGTTDLDFLEWKKSKGMV